MKRKRGDEIKGGVKLKKRKKRSYHFFDKEKSIKLISWNVNGLNAVLRKKKGRYFKKILKEEPTIICLQETKLNPNNKVHSLFSKLVGENYNTFYNSCKSKNGYQGDRRDLLHELEVCHNSCTMGFL